MIADRSLMEIDMASKIWGLVLTTSLLGSQVVADDCTDPVASWQPREQLRQLLFEQGWEVKRIQVHDGCYVVKGFDPNGHRVRVRFQPASFRVLELEVTFNSAESTADYLDIEFHRQ